MYLDIAIGLIVGLVIAFLFGEHSLPLVLFGVVAALAPDIDFILYLIKRRFKVDQFAHEHRDLFHMPLIFSGGGALLLSCFSPVYGLVWGLGSLWHFVHDTFDGGWGIRWFHPFYTGYFTLASYSPRRHFPTKAIQRAVATAHGNPLWLEQEYFVPNKKLFIEVAFLVSALLAVGFWYFKI
jgi:hypothetical protein